MASLFKKTKDRTSKEKVRTVSGTSIQGYNPLNPLNAPTEVAQATRFHTARNINELSFKRGDFFHVISRDIAPDGTIEIFDPIKNLKGRAPSDCFKLFEKTHHQSDGDNGISSNTNSLTDSVDSSLMRDNLNINDHFQHQQPRHFSTTSTSSVSSSTNVKKEPVTGNLFGVVLYDFNAERSDELSVTAGDSIFICAHHEYEWYIAKFLNKVGEVGLVPVSYVQLIDAVTRIPYKEPANLIIEKENLPSVEEWKAVKNKHKASSRTVGLHDSNNSNNSPLSRNSSTGNFRSKSITRSPLKKNISQSLIVPIRTNIESFSSTNNKFWFLIRVTMSDNTTRSLCRYYEDFFNFHQKILSTWPREGGKFDNKDKKDRILPFIPGPVIDVTESLCHKRLIDLNEYLVVLLRLPDYISKSNLVNSFFDIMDGDEISNFNVPRNSYVAVEPNRPAPNLKIINSDRQSASNSQQQQQQQYSGQIQGQNHYQHQSQNSNLQNNETLSQSNHDRRSQYEMNNVNNSRSSRTSGFNSLRKSSTASLVSQHLLPQNIPQSAPQQDAPSTTRHKNTASDKIKLKFYYKDDIFAIVVANDITLSELKSLIVPRIDESDTPGIATKIELYSKNSSNVSQSEFDPSQALHSDSDLWEDSNFTDKGKFLVVV